ncbi:uncharacterized protein LOC115069967 [Nannospalax galili]|uniref:uncharacterized protein LOC115069967 n=1 Tax=Nannospalax galili TaxID=1026970 RepID=UPI00111C0225|nr:uncharacterized protein LOC115069967 [Nannospalax galili]
MAVFGTCFSVFFPDSTGRVAQVCPWFPEQGSLNIDVWQKLGKELQDFYDTEGPLKVPIDAFSLWMLIRDSLDKGCDTEASNKECDLSEQVSALHLQETFPSSRTQRQPEKDSQVTRIPFAGSSSHATGVCPPQMRKNSAVNSLPLMSPLQTSLQHAATAGEDVSEFHAFPVMERDDGQGNRVRTHILFPFKSLKELKSACAQYGPTAPFTQAVLESMTTEALAPNDWKQIARACLSGGEFLLWKSEFGEFCQVTADLNRAQNIPITFDMLAGEGQYRETEHQINFPIAVYAQTSAAAKKAWNKLPTAGRQIEDLARIRQGPDELYQDFESRLLMVAGRLLRDSDASLQFVKHLAYENANSACQAALRPYRKKGNLSDYIRLCSDIGPSYTQGVAIAAVLQNKPVKDVLFQQHNKKRCFKCGQPGHFQNQCPRESSIIARTRKFFVAHIRAHTSLPGSLTQGNDLADLHTKIVAFSDMELAQQAHAKTSAKEIFVYNLLSNIKQEFHIIHKVRALLNVLMMPKVALLLVGCGILLLLQIMPKSNGRILVQVCGMTQILSSFGEEGMFVFFHRMLTMHVGYLNASFAWLNLRPPHHLCHHIAPTNVIILLFCACTFGLFPPPGAHHSPSLDLAMMLPCPI